MVHCGFPRSHEICIYRNLDDSCHYPETDGECVFGSRFIKDPLAEFVKGLNTDDKAILKNYYDGGGI